LAGPPHLEIVGGQACALVVRGVVVHETAVEDHGHDLEALVVAECEIVSAWCRPCARISAADSCPSEA
jgi:hypothetical protein